ncbi:MAG: hypothetical protein ACT4OY_07245 [Alphaproteobacteria bacterium]
MKSKLLLFCTLALAFATTSYAAEVYLKKDRDSALPPAIGSAKPSFEGGPDSIKNPLASDMKVPAENYYANCITKKHPMLDEDSQKKLCACTAGKFMQSMTLDEVRTMQDNTAEGQLNRNKMVMQVYTPCIEFPAYALVHTSCVNNPQVKAFQGYQGICNCVSSNMALYVRDNAPATIQGALLKNPADLDPLRAMLESEGFDRASQSTLQACLVGKTR